MGQLIMLQHVPRSRICPMHTAYGQHQALVTPGSRGRPGSLVWASGRLRKTLSQSLTLLLPPIGGKQSLGNDVNDIQATRCQWSFAPKPICNRHSSTRGSTTTQSTSTALRDIVEMSIISMDPTHAQPTSSWHTALAKHRHGRIAAT